ncbi:hypothetical protein ACFL5M_04635 [Candidatus Neomarinimicrobiota bacterium]
MTKVAFRKRVSISITFAVGFLMLSSLGLFTTGCSKLLEEQVTPDGQQSISDFDTTACVLLSDTVFIALESPNIDSIDIAWTSGGADTLAGLLDTMVLDTRMVIQNLHSGTAGYAFISSGTLDGENIVMFFDDYWSVIVISEDGDTIPAQTSISLESLAECPTIAMRLAYTLGSVGYLVKIDKTEATILDFYNGNESAVEDAFHLVLLQE